MFAVTCGIWCLADVSSVSPSSEQTVCSEEGLTLETSAKHHIPQATNIPYHITPTFVVVAKFDFKLEALRYEKRRGLAFYSGTSCLRS